MSTAATRTHLQVKDGASLVFGIVLDGKPMEAMEPIGPEPLDLKSCRRSGRLIDVAVHEAAHAYSYMIMRTCVNEATGETYRVDLRNLFGGEEFLADAITAYFNGANAFQMSRHRNRPLPRRTRRLNGNVRHLLRSLLQSNLNRFLDQ